MAISWSSWHNVGSNGMRIGIEASTSSVSHSSSSCTITWKVYTQNRYQYSDNNQTIQWSGNLSGTTTYDNNQGAQSITLRATRTTTHNYTSTQYGSSPGSHTVTVRVGYSYNGSHPSETLTVAIPARPYAAPGNPSNVTADRTTASNNDIYVSWDRPGSHARPVTYQTVQRRYVEGITDDWVSIFNWGTDYYSNGTSSFTYTGAASNAAIQFRVQLYNSAGESSWVYSNVQYTNAAAPSNLNPVRQSNDDIRLTWTVNRRYANGTTQIERSANGGAWTVVASGIQENSPTWTDTSPAAQNRYRARDYTTAPGINLYTAYTYSPTVYTTPPAPTGATATATTSGDSVTVRWKNTVPHDWFTVFVERQIGNGSWTTITGALWNTSTYVDNSPGIGKNRYRVRANTDGMWSSYAYTAYVDTNTPPLAPALRNPSNGASVDFDTPFTFEWVHNPGPDGADQTQFRLRYTTDGSTWSTVGPYTQTEAAWSPLVYPAFHGNGFTYTWQVSTKGIHPDWSPWSSSFVVTSTADSSAAPPGGTTAVELRMLTPEGDWGPMLPHWKDLEFSQGESISFSYPSTGANFDLLTGDRPYVVVLVAGQEPQDMRFKVVADSGASTSGDTMEHRFGGTATVKLFDKMLVAPAYGSTSNSPFTYTDKTAGHIVRELINNYMSRAVGGPNTPFDPADPLNTGYHATPHWLQWPNNSWTDTVDSNGQAWGYTIDHTVEGGTTIAQVLEQLSQLGHAEITMEGKLLRVLTPESNTRDLTDSVVLHAGKDLLTATYDRSKENLVTGVLVLGADNACKWVTAPQSVVDAYGYTESTLSVNAVTQATMEAAGRAWLGVRQIPRYSYSYSAVSVNKFDPHKQRMLAAPIPFVDYRRGDKVLVSDALGVTAQRIMLLSGSASDSAEAIEVAVTVNDFFDDREVEFDKRLKRLGG